MTQETLPPTTSPARDGARRRPRQGPGPGDHRLRGQLLGMVAAEPARPPLPGAARPEPAGRLGDGGRAGDRRVARPHPPGRAHRPLRRPDRVRGPVVRGHRPGAVPGLRHLLPGAAGRRPPARPRRGLVRGRGAVRQRLVPARAPRRRPRHLRHGQHRHRHLRVRHPPGGQLARPALGVPDRGRRAGRRRPRLPGPGPRRPQPAAGHRAVHDPVPGRRPPAHRPRPGRPVRHHLRRLRGLRRLPAHLPQDRLRP